MNYKIAYLSYNNDDSTLMHRSKQILDTFFKSGSYTFCSDPGPILFVASGGSEQHAERITKNHDNIILMCHRENNSYAAAIEIAAFIRAQHKRVHIVDVMAAEAYRYFIQLQEVYRAIDSLKNQRAALIGEVSDWLIMSDVDTQRVKDLLGIELLRMPWSELESYHRQDVSKEFLRYFPDEDPARLHDTAKVYSLLKKVVEEKQLSAISVECFSMVVRDKVTACLPLAVLNKEQIVAACEGDICAMLGKMILRSIAHQVPWQANIAEIKSETILFAHCTAPLSILNSFEIDTHFETNCGTAIRGKFAKQRMGVFRINNQLDKFTLIEGEIVNTPDYDFACRTQIELEVGVEQCKLLKNNSLGNHQILFPAQYKDVLLHMMQILGLERVQ